MTGFIENSLMPMSASPFSLLQCVSDEACEENQALDRHMVARCRGFNGLFRSSWLFFFNTARPSKLDKR